MGTSIEIRPMHEGDVGPVHEVGMAAFGDLDRRFGRYPAPPPSREREVIRLRHLVASDPGGALIAERSGEVVGCALAILREGIWGLSYLVVRPDVQSAGVGRELLAHAFAYGRRARGWIVLSSKDPRAMRAYARLGLAMHPCVYALGRPRKARAPAGVRAGTREDLALIEAVDRAVRGAPHGEDICALLDAGATLLVAPERGYAAVRDGVVKLLAAYDEAGARDLLRALLARVEGEALVEWISSAQGWAVDVCLDAGLDLQASSGPIFLRGDVGPFRPYLPSGSYL